MLRKIFVFLAFMFPFSVFAFTVSITNADNYLYTVTYRVCTAYGPYISADAPVYSPYKINRLGNRQIQFVELKSGSIAQMVSNFQ